MTKERMIEMLCDYAESEIIPGIRDINTKMVADMLIGNIRRNHKAADVLLGNPVFAMFIAPDENGEYDIDNIINSLEHSTQKYGPLSITLPKVKFLLPEEQVLKFGAGDFSSMRNYM